MFEKKIDLEYLNLSKLTYGGEFYLELDGYKQRDLKLDGLDFKKVVDTCLLKKEIDTFFCYKCEDSGCSVNLFENIKNGNLIIAYRGTERLGLGENVSDFGVLSKDIATDVSIITGTSDNQFLDAWKFFKAVKSQNPDRKIIVIGQSLGGALAQIVSAKEYTINRNKIETYTYNAPGCFHLLDVYDCNQDLNYSFITNYSVMNDWCGTFGIHVGQLYYIAPIKLLSVNINSQEEVFNNILLTSHEGIFDYSVENMGQIIKNPKNFTDLEGLALWYYDKNNPLNAFPSFSEYIWTNILKLNFPKVNFMDEPMKNAKKFFEENTPDFIQNSNFALSIKTLTENFVNFQEEQKEKLLEMINSNLLLIIINYMDARFEQLSPDVLTKAVNIVKKEFKNYKFL